MDNDFATSTDLAVSFSGNGNGPWTYYDNGLRPAFEIDGDKRPESQTPEPAMFLLLGSGLAILAVVTRRKAMKLVR